MKQPQQYQYTCLVEPNSCRLTTDAIEETKAPKIKILQNICLSSVAKCFSQSDTSFIFKRYRLVTASGVKTRGEPPITAWTLT